MFVAGGRRFETLDAINAKMRVAMAAWPPRRSNDLIESIQAWMRCPDAAELRKVCVPAAEIRTCPSLLKVPALAYSVKEVFYTLQGEGAHAGRPAVFCRFSGCNLWSGREADRETAVCRFCDTDFVGTDGQGGGKFADAQTLAGAIDGFWPPQHPDRKYVVFTGGEPLLQLDDSLVEAMHGHGFQIAIETNGTLDPPAGIDWICVSPKMGAPLRLKRGNELKVVVPQKGQPLADYEALDFEHFYLQPMDGPLLAQNTRLAIESCKARPQWKLSLQTHKLLQIP